MLFLPPGTVANGDTPDKVLCENFLAVQDSSIGDLVTHSLTDSLSESGFDFSNFRAEQSRAEQSRAEQSRADSDLDLGLG